MSAFTAANVVLCTKKLAAMAPKLSFVIALTLTACAPSTPNKAPSILLFTGPGTSANDVAAVESILKQEHLSYATANAHQLNALNASQLLTYRLLIVPGGNFIVMSDSLSPRTMSNIHDAVQNGLNYLGICAGAFLAGHGTYNSVNLASDVQFRFYEAEERGVRKAVVVIASVGTPPVEHYWEDGPQLTGWGAVVAKYPDGTPAVVEGQSGKGWVVLTGVHPEAPESWRRGMTFTTPARVANAYAATLVGAALNGTVLPHY